MSIDKLMPTPFEEISTNINTLIEKTNNNIKVTYKGKQWWLTGVEDLYMDLILVEDDNVEAHVLLSYETFVQLMFEVFGQVDLYTLYEEPTQPSVEETQQG